MRAKIQDAVDWAISPRSKRPLSIHLEGMMSNVIEINKFIREKKRSASKQRIKESDFKLMDEGSGILQTHTSFKIEPTKLPKPIDVYPSTR